MRVCNVLVIALSMVVFIGCGDISDEGYNGITVQSSSQAVGIESECGTYPFSEDVEE